MARIKLVHLTSSLKIGGAEEVLFTLAAQLDSQKFDQQVIYFHEGPYVEKLRSIGIPVHYVKGLFFRYDPVFFIRLYRMLKKLNPDRLHTLLWVANFTGRICAWLQRIPIVSVFHNNVDQDGALRNYLDRFSLSFADRLVAVSEPVKESAVRYLGCTQEIAVIRNGIFIHSQESSSQTRASIGLSHADYIIGAVGRFEPVKRYDLLLVSLRPLMEKYPQVRLCLIGIGSQEKALRELADKLGISNRIVFLIGQPAREYYHLFDCFVQSTAKEGISLALLEAMNFGVPSVVMHDTLDHPVIHSGQNGLVVQSEDFAGLRARLQELLENEPLRKRLGGAGRDEVIQHFDAQGMVAAYEEVFTGHNSF